MEDSSIMVVENEPSLRELMMATLKQDVFIVAEVSDYFEALWKLGEFKPDLVIVDEQLPFVDGWEACERINKTFGIPVIITGSTSGPESWQKALAAGADYYLKVPCGPLEFNARIKAILRRYQDNDSCPK